MSKKPPLFSGSTTRLALEVRPSPEGVEIILQSSNIVEDLPIWDQVGLNQIRGLQQRLQSEVGAQNVELRRVEGSTDKRIIVKPPAEASRIIPLVSTFVDEHQMELDTGDEQHFRQLVTGATTQKNLEDGIKLILGDQLLDTDQKTNALLVLFKTAMKSRATPSMN